MAIVRLFAAAREVAGRGRDDVPGGTVAEVLDTATDRYGPAFAAVLPTCRVWVNGEAVPHETRVGPDDEVAVLPPVSGGAPDRPACAGRHHAGRHHAGRHRAGPITAEEPDRG